MADFQKCCRPFFYDDQIDILSSPKSLKSFCFGSIFPRRRQNFEKQARKALFAIFWKILTKKFRFLARFPIQS